MNNFLDIHFETTKELTAEASWKLMKIGVSGTSIQYSARKQKAKKNLVQALEKRLQKLNTEIDTAGGLFLDAVEQKRLVQHNLNKTLKEKALGAQIRSKARWTSQGEYPTKYYLNLEKKNVQNRTISRLFDSEGKLLTDTQEILQEIRMFYQNLYTTRGTMDMSYVDTVDIPQLSEEVKEQLDSPITLDEISQALASM